MPNGTADDGSFGWSCPRPVIRRRRSHQADAPASYDGTGHHGQGELARTTRPSRGSGGAPPRTDELKFIDREQRPTPYRAGRPFSMQ